MGANICIRSAKMASLIAILDLKGKPLIQRSYRDDVPPSYIERFLPIILDLEEEGQQVTPCFSKEGVNYMHIRHSNLYRKPIAITVHHRVSIPLGLSSRAIKTKHKCCRSCSFPAPISPGAGRVFQGTRRGVDQRQLRHYLRAYG